MGGVPARQVEPMNCIGPVAPLAFTVPGGLQPEAWLRPWSHSIFPIAASTAQSTPYREAACSYSARYSVGTSAMATEEGEPGAGLDSHPPIAPTTTTIRRRRAVATTRTPRTACLVAGVLPATEPAVIPATITAIQLKYGCLPVSVNDVAQASGPERHRLDGDALVGGVHERRRDVGRQTHRHEPVGLDPEPADVTSVGVARKEHRDRNTVRIALAHDAREERKEREVGITPNSRLLGCELKRCDVARKRLELADEVVWRHPGQDAPVEVNRQLARDDVGRTSTAEDGRRCGIGEKGRERLRRALREPQNAAAKSRSERRANCQTLVRGKRGRHRVQHQSRDWRYMHRQRARREPRQKCAELLACRITDNCGCVAACTTRRRPDEAALLLGDLNRHEAPSATPERVTTELAQRITNALEQIAVLFHEKLHAGATARLLVSRQRKQKVPRRRCLRPRHLEQARHEHGDAALHVERASPPHLVADAFAAERRVLPFGRFRGDHVDVAVEEERRGVAAPGHTRKEIRSVRLEREVSMLDASSIKQAADELEASPLVAGRIRGVEPDQRLEQLDMSD